MTHKTLSSAMSSGDDQSIRDRIAMKKQRSQSVKTRITTPEKASPPPKLEGDPLSLEDTQALGEQIGNLKTRLSEASDRLALTDTISEMENHSNRLPRFRKQLEKIREGGYKFYDHLESQITDTATLWDTADNEIDTFLESGDSDLEDELAQLYNYLKHLGVQKPNTAHKKLADKIETSLDEFDQKLSDVESTMRDILSPIQKNSHQISSRINKIEKYIELSQEAGFDLNPSEAVVMAAKAEWQDGDKPDGVVYITTNRIIFEQKEKTGKKFGMFGGKDTQQVLWKVQNTDIQSITPEDKGLMGGKDYMIVSTPTTEYKVEIKGGYDSKSWCQDVEEAIR